MKKTKKFFILALSLLAIMAETLAVASCEMILNGNLFSELQSSNSISTESNSSEDESSEDSSHSSKPEDSSTSSSSSSTHTHSYKEEVTAPTCTEQGYTTYTCACGDSYVDSYVKENGHTEIIDQAVSPTCTETGLTEGKHCSVCSTILVAQETVNATGHSYSEEVTAPTCTEQGYTTYTCACGDSYVDSYVKENGHTYVEWIIDKEATCKETGEKHRVCTVCAKGYVHEEIPLTDHIRGNWNTVKQSTCSEEGVEAVVCATCNEVIDSRPIEKSKHDLDEEGNCLNCDYTKAFDYFNFTELADGTYSVTAKKGVELPADIIIPSKYNGKNVTALGYRAFYNCSKITSLTIPGTIASIGAHAFYECYIDYIYVSNLESWLKVEFKDKYSYPNRNYSAYGLHILNESGNEITDIKIPDGITCINDYAFYNCYNITNITIPNSVTTIDDYAFTSCRNLVNINIPNSVTSIGKSAFSSCYKLIEIILPEGITSIGYATFGSCNNLTRITLPKSLTLIDDQAFSYCSALTEIKIPSGVTYIGASAFQHCYNLANIMISSNVSFIGSSAFWYCNNLTIICEAEKQPTEWKEDWNSSNRPVIWGIPTHDHIYEAIITNPTCIKGGYTTYQCGICAYSYVSDYTDIVDHTESDWIIDRESTCKFEGQKHIECTVCQRILKTEYIPELPHIEGEWKINPEPTCQKEGLKYTTCSVCNIIVNEVTLEKIDHTYVSQVAPPTCVEQGYTKHTCSICKDSYIDSYVDIIEHTEGEWEILTQPTCIKTGEKHKKCTVCGMVLKRESLEVIEHTESDWIVDQEATCTKAGKQHTKCTVCHKVLQERNIEISHSYRDQIINPTCENQGYTRYKCVYCFHEYIDNYIDATGHTEVIDTAIEPTCSKTGLTEGKHCSICKKVLISQEIIPATEDHIINKSGYCSVCEYSCFSFTELDNATYSIAVKNKAILPSTVVIPSSHNGIVVTSIEKKAFSSCVSLTSITVPDSVTYIGDIAFYNCTGLTSVTIPDSVTYIGSSTFENCSNLTSVTIPDSVTSINSSAFKKCISLTSVTIPDSVTYIGDSAFEDCSGLTSVTIPDSVTYIGSSTFENCSNLTSVTIPDSVRTIEEEAFYYCNHLETIILPDSVTSIGKNAFSTTAYELNKKNWENNNAFYIGNHLIRVTPNFNDTQITVKYGTRTIADYAFADYLSDGLANDNNYVRAVMLPETITHIGRFAFYSCSALDNIIIPDSVIYIGEDAFYKCTGLESMTIPFTGESRDATGYKSHFGYIFGINIKSTSSANEYHYKDAPYYFYTFNIPSGLREITFKGDILKTSVFRNCKNVTNFVLQKNLSNIGEKAFENCANVTNIIIPESVTLIDDSAFRNCTNLTNIIIGNNVTSIGNYVFTNCSKLTNVYYKGTAEDWSKITIGSDNSTLTNSTRYYYSETKPTAEGNYWYYNENGEIAVWENSNSTEE